MAVDPGTPDGPLAMLERLRRATNDHDLEALVACFAPGYRNETPAHPGRGFTGRDQVRKNWEQIFRFVPDLTADVLAYTIDADTIWTEWEHRGTRPDGSGHVMRGVVIFGVRDGLAEWARFFLEPLDDGGGDSGGGVDGAIRRQVAPGLPS